jgi:hypothetical protein
MVRRSITTAINGLIRRAPRFVDGALVGMRGRAASVRGKRCRNAIEDII